MPAYYYIKFPYKNKPDELVTLPESEILTEEPIALGDSIKVKGRGQGRKTTGILLSKGDTPQICLTHTRNKKSNRRGRRKAAETDLDLDNPEPHVTKYSKPKSSGNKNKSNGRVHGDELYESDFSEGNQQIAPHKRQTGLRKPNDTSDDNSKINTKPSYSDSDSDESSYESKEKIAKRQKLDKKEKNGKRAKRDSSNDSDSSNESESSEVFKKKKGAGLKKQKYSSESDDESEDQAKGSKKLETKCQILQEENKKLMAFLKELKNSKKVKDENEDESSDANEEPVGNKFTKYNRRANGKLPSNAVPLVKNGELLIDETDKAKYESKRNKKKAITAIASSVMRACYIKGHPAFSQFTARGRKETKNRVAKDPLPHTKEIIRFCRHVEKLRGVKSRDEEKETEIVKAINQTIRDLAKNN